VMPDSSYSKQKQRTDMQTLKSRVSDAARRDDADFRRYGDEDDR
jgi:hypothetical protein